MGGHPLQVIPGMIAVQQIKRAKPFRKFLQEIGYVILGKLRYFLDHVPT